MEIVEGIEKLWVSPYELKLRNDPRPARKGFLLKIQGRDFKTGYGDCMSWPELGDLDRESLLKVLENKDLSPESSNLLLRTLSLAVKDGLAREEKRALFGESQRIRNHFLVLDLPSLTREALENLWQQGFRSLKIKVGFGPSTEFRSFMERLADTPLLFSVRLDFNGRYSEEWLPVLRACKKWLEFIEDPYPIVDRGWLNLREETGLSLARDFAKMPDPELSSHFQYYVCKPAREAWQDLSGLQGTHQLIFTSYLGHPLGQARDQAEAAAANAFKNDCGLLSHTVYDPNGFSRAMTVNGPHFSAPGLFGVGFDSQLEAISWKLLF